MPGSNKYIVPEGITPSPSESTSAVSGNVSRETMQNKFKATYLQREAKEEIVEPDDLIEEDENESVNLKQMSPELSQKIKQAMQVQQGEQANVASVVSKFTNPATKPVFDPVNMSKNLSPEETRRRAVLEDPSKYSVSDYKAGTPEPGLEQVYPVEETLFTMLATPAGRTALATGQGLIRQLGKESLSTLTYGANEVAARGLKGFTKNMLDDNGLKSLRYKLEDTKDAVVKKTLGDEYFKKSLAKKIDVNNLDQYIELPNDLSDLPSGSFAFGVSPRRSNDLIVKVGDRKRELNSIPELSTFDHRDINDLKIEGVPKYYNSTKEFELLDNETNEKSLKSLLVMSRVKGKSLDDMSLSQISKIDNNSILDIMKKREALRKFGVSTDMIGSNVFYDSKSKKAGLIDLNPISSSNDWNGVVDYGLTKNTEEGLAKSKIKSTTKEHFFDGYDRAASRLANDYRKRMIRENYPIDVAAKMSVSFYDALEKKNMAYKSKMTEFFKNTRFNNGGKIN